MGAKGGEGVDAENEGGRDREAPGGRRSASRSKIRRERDDGGHEREDPPPSRRPRQERIEGALSSLLSCSRQGRDRITRNSRSSLGLSLRSFAIERRSGETLERRQSLVPPGDKLRPRQILQLLRAFLRTYFAPRRRLASPTLPDSNDLAGQIDRRTCLGTFSGGERASMPRLSFVV